MFLPAKSNTFASHTVYTRVRINRALAHGICNWTRFESPKENIKNEIAAGPIKQNKQNDPLEWRNMNSEIRWFFTWPACGFARYRVHSSSNQNRTSRFFPRRLCSARCRPSIADLSETDQRTSRSTSFISRPLSIHRSLTPNGTWK